MTISQKHFSTIVFLTEISVQCDLFFKAYRRLEEASEHWINLDNGIDDGAQFPPLEILSECTVCLSALSAINRLLFSEKTGLARDRSRHLQTILGDICLDLVSSKKVRNAWEHNDDRMDKELNKFDRYSSLSTVHVKVKPPKENSCVLKRFDPTELSISFLSDKIHLGQCLNEIQSLSERVNIAFTNFNELKTD